jgi:hypothetical protein
VGADHVRDGHDAPFPYERLAIIYRRRHDYVSEVAVLERALEVLQRVCDQGRIYALPQLARFSERLGKARRLLSLES